MGRSGMSGGRSGGGGRGSSGGGRSGGSRSSGRSAMGSSSRSFSSSQRSAAGSSMNRSAAGGGMPRGGYGGAPMGGPIGGPMPRRPRRRVFFGGWPFYRPYGRTVIINNGDSTSTGTGRGGRFTTLIMICIWLVLIWGLFSMVGGGLGGSYGSSNGSSADVTKSTVNRHKLQLELDDTAGYYTDECDWIRNRTTLENGLKDFYNSTGILPYVYIIDNVDGDYDPSTEKLEAFADARYTELFSDDGHMLLVFWDYGGAYEYVLWLGDDTIELMDTEACDILFDYLDYYYYYADTEEEFFADAFAEAGQRIMTVTRSPMYYILIVGGAAIIIFVIYKGYKSRKDKEAERKKRAEEILNSPLEKFGDNGDIIDDLEKKYEKEI